MKQGGLIIAGLVLLFSLCVLPVAAQTRSVNYETYIVDNFDNPDASEWTWIAAGSKFTTKGYPVLKYFDGMPNAIRVMQTNAEGGYKFLGMEVKFDRKGDNWVDIVPVKKNSGDKYRGDFFEHEDILRGEKKCTPVFLFIKDPDPGPGPHLRQRHPCPQGCGYQ